MVRNPTLQEPLDRTRGVGMTPAQPRARRRSFAFGNLDVENADVTREVVARADADFDRIFGSST
jgi:hypothetical protein